MTFPEFIEYKAIFEGFFDRNASALKITNWQEFCYYFFNRSEHPELSKLYSASLLFEHILFPTIPRVELRFVSELVADLKMSTSELENKYGLESSVDFNKITNTVFVSYNAFERIVNMSATNEEFKIIKFFKQACQCWISYVNGMRDKGKYYTHWTLVERRTDDDLYEKLPKRLKPTEAVSKCILMKNIPKIYSFSRNVHHKLEKKLIISEEEENTASYVKKLQFPIYEALMFDSRKEIEFIVKELIDRLEGEHPQVVPKSKNDTTVSIYDLPWKILSDSILMNPTAENRNNTAKYDISIDSVISIINEIRNDLLRGELQPPYMKEDPVLNINKKDDHLAGKLNKGKRFTSLPWFTGFTFWHESKGITFDNYPAETSRRVINIIRPHAVEEIPQLPGYQYLNETIDNQAFKPKKKAVKKEKKNEDIDDDEEEKPVAPPKAQKKVAAPKEEKKAAPKKKAASKKTEVKSIEEEPSEDEEEEHNDEEMFEHEEEDLEIPSKSEEDYE